MFFNMYNENEITDSESKNDLFKAAFFICNSLWLGFYP